MAVVMIETPYSGDIDRNVRYLALCNNEAALLYDECPYASHGLMTQHPRAEDFFVSDYEEKWNVLTRDSAIEMSQRIRKRCDKTVFYTDLGWSRGMEAAKQYCIDNQLPFEERKLDIAGLSAKIPFCSSDFCNSIVNPESNYTPFLQ